MCRFQFGQQLAKLLEMLCTQFDWWLDNKKKVFPDGNDQYAEAINNTRSRALENLIRFGWWLRRNDQQADVSIVTMILEKRFSPEAEYPLTLPERALLGENYSRVPGLDEAWAVEHRSDFFPRDSLTEWREAFGSFLRFNRPNVLIFGVLREDFEFALQHLGVLNNRAFPVKIPLNHSESICSPTICGTYIHSREQRVSYSDSISGPTMLASVGGIYLAMSGFSCGTPIRTWKRA